MRTKTLSVLLLENNLADAELIEELLEQEKFSSIKIENVDRLQDALKILNSSNFDVILLGLSHPDSQETNIISQLKKKKPNVPIIVLTMLNDLNTAIRSVRKGAQDYLDKNSLEAELLIRSIRYAIERQRHEKAWRKRAERERLMAKMLERIHQSLDLQTILQTTVDEVRQFLQTDRVLIYRGNNSESRKIVVQSPRQQQNNTSLQVFPDSILGNNSFSFNDSGTNYFYLQGNEDCPKTNLSEKTIEQIESPKSASALLTVPIWQNESFDSLSKGSLEKFDLISQSSADELWGTLVAHSHGNSRQWQNWEIDFLKQLATQVGIAIQQSQLYTQLRTVNEKLKKLVIQDGLTGIANRRHFEQTLDSEWQRLAREQKPLSLILCDVDFFKNYNDSCGHPAGDACLKEIAKVLTEAIKRPADLVARYGGEEFAIILPDTSDRGALWVAERIRQQLQQLKLPHPRSPIGRHVTLSMGVATIIPNGNRLSESLVREADRALYQAKSKGRDRVFQLD
jgi:two-component system cell cycle response regulator